LRKLASAISRFTVVLFAALLLIAPAMSTTVPTQNHPCSSLIIQTDKESYTLGEPVVITINFAALLPGCVESMIVHSYLLTIQVFNSSNHEMYSSNHTTPGTTKIAESWTPMAIGDYSINATSWVTFPGNDLMTRQLQAYKLIQVQDPEQWLTFGVTGIVAALAVAASYLTIRHRRRGHTS